MSDYSEIIKKASILVEALPYMQALSGKTVVIKYGGNAMINDDLKHSVMEDITLLKYIGLNPIIVHGGGPDVSAALNNFNIKSEFINGLRKTDKQTMEVAQMVLMGKTNKEIVSLMNQNGGKAVGLCGIDGMLFECEKHYERVNGEDVDLGFVGRITKVNTRALEILTQDEYIPVIAPIGTDKSGKSYNINADTAAAELASALKAEKLMLLTDVEGVRSSNDDIDSILYFITSDKVNQLIEEGIISGGMIPKVLGCVYALKNGVNRAHIIDGRIPHCILLEIFTNKGIGTMITNEAKPYYDKEKL